MPKNESKEHVPTFQESAKKFKPGPVAPPEREEDRPDMSGGRSADVTAGGRFKRTPPDPAHSSMSDGEPGHLKKMPRE